MNEYNPYPYPEYEGPVATPLGCCEAQKDIKITPVLGPVPCPPNTQEPIKPVAPACKPPIIAPLPPHRPPEHTQVQPRCFTCTHFEMCGYKRDYLKTVRLIQHDLGAPQLDYELTDKYITIPGFVGFSLFNQEKYLPEEAIFSNDDSKGRLFLSKFNGINFVNIVYMVKRNYILIELKYSKETELYELKNCAEAFYGIKYELDQKTLEEIQVGLIDWREMIVNAKMPPHCHKKDVINTTHFSAALNCDMYEWNKSSFEDAIHKMMIKYPYGIPIDEDGKVLYHVATYHIEQGEVPYAPLYFGQKDKCIAPYIPPMAAKQCKPSKRRGDM